MIITPVKGNPFENRTPAVELVPVEGNPFEEENSQAPIASKAVEDAPAEPEVGPLIGEYKGIASGAARALSKVKPEKEEELIAESFLGIYIRLLKSAQKTERA